MNIGTTTVAAFALALNVAVVPSPGLPDAGTSGVVVNEFVPGAYVELRNRSGSTVDISGFNLWLCGPDEVTTELRVGLGRSLSPGDFYVIASSSFTGAPVDQTHHGALPGGGAVLLDTDYVWADGTAVVTDSPCGEGAPAPACQEASTARDAASTDTGSNIADFACRTRSPGESELLR